MMRTPRLRTLTIALAAASALFVGGACKKPSKDECRKAIQNMRSLLGTEKLTSTDVEGEVRRCNGGSKKEAVQCASKATSIAELNACKFMHHAIPEDGTPVGSGSALGSGSATGSGSAVGTAAGSADTGSNSNTDASGSGSAAGSAMGSAAGSAK